MKIDLRHLLQIEALNKHRNFARAAKELGISQPGLSQSLRLLEDQLGYNLFDRNARDVTPTAFGEHALRLGQNILRDTRRLDRELGMLANLEAGTIRIGMGFPAAEVLLSKTLGRLAARYPNLTVKTLVAPSPLLYAKLLKGELDGIVADTRIVTNAGELEVIDLPRYQACYVCRPDHPLAGQVQVSIKDVLEFPLATYKLCASALQILSKLSGVDFSASEILPYGFIEAPCHMLARIVQQSKAVALGILPFFREEIDKGTLRVLPLQTPEITTHYGIISLDCYTASPALQLFKQFTIESSHEL